MTNKTDWKKVLEDNRDAIEEKMVELYGEWEGNNKDVHEGLAIEPSGNLYTWTYVGQYSEPETTWNGTDRCITIFSAWHWTDYDRDWKNIALSYARNDEEKECIIRRIKETRKELNPISEMIQEEFPEVYAEIAQGEIDAEINSYRENVSAILDEIMRNID